MSSKVIDNLVRNAKSGSAEAFGVLYEAYREDMYKFAYYYTGSSVIAEDCISECVVIAFEKIGSLKKSASFKAWLFKILYNCCNKALKEKIRDRENVELSELRHRGTYEDYSEAVSLKNALMRLSEEEREIILLRYYFGYNSKEIGKLLGIKASTVRSKLMRATEKLREMLHMNEVTK